MALGGDIPTNEAISHRVCPECGAEVDEPCNTFDGVGRPHKSRAQTHKARLALVGDDERLVDPMLAAWLALKDD